MHRPRPFEERHTHRSDVRNAAPLLGRRRAADYSSARYSRPCHTSRKPRRTAARRALSRAVAVTRRHAVDRHHFEANLRPSTGWTGLLEPHGSLAEVLVEAASSRDTGTSCWRWRTICGITCNSGCLGPGRSAALCGCFCVKMAAVWLCRYGAWEDRRDLAAGGQGRPFRPGLLRRNGNASGLDH